MRWVTRPDVHLDRAASAWLIRRFIDVDAVFEFSAEAPGDASRTTAFGLSGAALSPVAEAGEFSTFRKVIEAFALDDPVLAAVATSVEIGIRIATGREQDRAESLFAYGCALAAFSEGLVVLIRDDCTRLSQAAVLYDALYISMYSTTERSSGRLPDNLGARIAKLRADRDWTVAFPPW